MNAMIDAVNRAFEAAMAAGDADGLANTYTANGNAMPANSPTITGTSALKAFWQGVIDMGVASVSLKTIELEDLGQAMNEVGEFTLKGADGSVMDSGKYIVVWKRENGQWKWHHDIWNSSLPTN